MTKKFIRILIFSFFCISIARAEVLLTDYKDFQTKWPLVTVRFREDSGEMRFTWGNEKGMKGLEAGKGDFEDGAVFAKVSFKSEEDPSFTSSKVPSGARRVQLMIRDQKKYEMTDGWGYFLFDSTGKPVKTDEKACAACHKIIPERGFVFSQKAATANLFETPQKHLPLALSESEVAFEDANLQAIPANFRKYLPTHGSRKMGKLIQPWFQSAFEGTADEIRPLLTKEALVKSKAAFYLSPDRKVLSYVSIQKTEMKCKENQVSMRAVIVFTPNIKNDISEIRTRELDFCAPRSL